MTEALYRTYRPQTFAEVVNQQHVRITLQNALQQQRVAHAYLFAGPRGIGKTTIARILARAVNCTDRQPDGEPCNRCPHCQALRQGKSLDIVEIDAASQTGVDNVRENIIQSARAIPAMAKMKVFIIDEVHMLSTAAFNALLKLLEEPPAHAMFILATTEVHRIPETIISRTQRFDFKKIGVEDIVARLHHVAAAEKRQLDAVVAERIARRSGGSIRDAETMLGQLFSFEEKHITNDIADLVLPRSDRRIVMGILTALVNGQATEALNQFHAFCDEGGDISHLVEQLIAGARALVLAAVDPRLLDQVTADFEQPDLAAILDLAKGTTTERLTMMVEEFLTAGRQLNRAIMAELPVELALIKIATASTRLGVEGSSTPLPRAKRPPSSGATLTVKPAPPAISPPPLSKTAAQEQPADRQLTLEAVRQAWRDIQRTIGQTQPSLGLSVQHTAVEEVNDQEIIVHAPFKLQADRLSDPKFNQPLVRTLEEKLGSRVILSVTLAAHLAPAPTPKKNTTSTAAAGSPKPKAKDLWDQVVASFGEA